jgi:hypothetical protein
MTFWYTKSVHFHKFYLLGVIIKNVSSISEIELTKNYHQKLITPNW